ncbi:hypothetical protein EIP91_003511 [Steccherinum ochraceum]|uniref:Uncharacterized protein n=1 Tax=Steccherinum ochraceum TaxID=92696 RepID=A0A4R0RNP8_9APHY|nr:hypothetical protein EIP91_003511 [Steccherinum ochraceum]
MSTATTPNDSPVGTPIQPMHNPSQAAHVSVPQAPLGNATNGSLNQAPGMGAKALLAKKMAKSINPTYISPTDNLMTPVSQKLNAAKKKHFTKGAQPMKPLFATKEASGSSEEETSPRDEKANDEENPF